MFGSSHAPSLAGGSEWLNSEPLDLPVLRGQVVLVNFWTLTCINWLRQEPYVRAWSHAYRSDGLVVIGVHTPEFSFEHDLEGVRRATQERGIDYPVVLDNGYEIWRAFNNKYWPALYFIDADGMIRDEQFGEGRYAQSERMIQRLLRVDRDLGHVDGTGVEAEADWEHLGSPETYLGYARTERFASPGGIAAGSRTYMLPDPFRRNEWGLAGEWKFEGESVRLEQGGGSIGYRFSSRDVHLVLSREAKAPIPFRVVLDGESPGRARGADVDEAGNGVLRDGRLYQLLRQHGEIRERTAEITFLDEGARAYSFTFG